MTAAEGKVLNLEFDYSTVSRIIKIWENSRFKT